MGVEAHVRRTLASRLEGALQGEEVLNELVLSDYEHAHQSRWQRSLRHTARHTFC